MHLKYVFKQFGANFLNYRVANKFSDTLNELFVVNWLISKTFGENTKWELASSSHFLKILVKSINHGLSLKRDQKSISKITFVPGFVFPYWYRSLIIFHKNCCLLLLSALFWPEKGHLDRNSFFKKDNAALNKILQFLWEIIKVLYQ